MILPLTEDGTEFLEWPHRYYKWKQQRLWVSLSKVFSSYTVKFKYLSSYDIISIWSFYFQLHSSQMSYLLLEEQK